MKSFGTRFKQLRKASGLTQEAIALELGLTKGAVSAWEAGASEPRIETLRALRSLLGVSFDDLVGDGSERSSGNLILSATERQLIQLYRKLPPSKRAAFLALLDQ
ncbi:helix-turn-helix domain-containing protein [Tahibacter caeni]|uniref:helix-turn-helix domain-containing protein n=1 Tax=Tahibacter caeni TaxID=1453545 RepID=UPI0021483C15|nr:helix-turn-helix transcriptional regulator [Tahibacter caeni]